MPTPSTCNGRLAALRPRTDALKKELVSYELMGGPPHGSATSLLGSVHNGVHFANPEAMNYHLKLPADLQRAAPEVYRDIRAEGVTSLRAWVLDLFPVQTRDGNPSFADLFTGATQADFELAPCKSELEIIQKLATSDSLEITMRKFASFIYQKRTHDKQGAQHMLGIRAPGSSTDVGPGWLIESASVHSKLEFQRGQRGGQSNKGGDYKGKPKGDSKGKPKGAGRGGGKQRPSDAGGATQG